MWRDLRQRALIRAEANGFVGLIVDPPAPPRRDAAKTRAAAAPGPTALQRAVASAAAFSQAHGLGVLGKALLALHVKQSLAARGVAEDDARDVVGALVHAMSRRG